MHPLNRRCWIFICLILNFFLDYSHAQRFVIPPTPDAPPVSNDSPSAKRALASVEDPHVSLILKTYPDGTKKIVPLEALNFRDEGTAYGGPPKLSLYTNSSISPSGSLPKSPERLSLAPIGSAGSTSSLAANLPPSADPMGGGVSNATAAGDPMGGAATNPMIGGGSSAPLDPLGGGGSRTAPPLQTVSGKPAPLVGDSTMLQLGEWESFFLNAGIGGSLQGQLTARRVDNGTNRQAYPYKYTSGILEGQEVSGENFTFQPGFRLDVEFGYNFYEWLGVGLQTGMTYNGLYQYNLTLADGSSFHNSADGELVQVPLQLNAILRWPGQMKFRPFIGGGIGAVWQQLDVNNYYIETLDVQGNYCRSAFQFGWNAQAGLTYTVEPGLDFYGAFKMLSAFMPVIGNYQFENSYNFAVEVGIQSRF